MFGRFRENSSESIDRESSELYTTICGMLKNGGLDINSSEDFRLQNIIPEVLEDKKKIKSGFNEETGCYEFKPDSFNVEHEVLVRFLKEMYNIDAKKSFVIKNLKEIIQLIKTKYRSDNELI